MGAEKAGTDRCAADLRHQSRAANGWPTRTCSARTCSTASTRWRSRCRRCASGAEDIPLLLEHYAALYAQKYNLARQAAWRAALIDRLMAWSWPGNVRALRHAVERAVILSEGDVAGRGGFSAWRSDSARPAPPLGDVSRLDAVEKAAIVRALEQHSEQCQPRRRGAGPDARLALPADGEIWPLAVSRPASSLRVARPGRHPGAPGLDDRQHRLVCDHRAVRRRCWSRR